RSRLGSGYGHPGAGRLHPARAARHRPANRDRAARRGDGPGGGVAAVRHLRRDRVPGEPGRAGDALGDRVPAARRPVGRHLADPAARTVTASCWSRLRVTPNSSTVYYLSESSTAETPVDSPLSMASESMASEWRPAADRDGGRGECPSVAPY